MLISQSLKNKIIYNVALLRSLFPSPSLSLFIWGGEEGKEYRKLQVFLRLNLSVKFNTTVYSPVNEKRHPYFKS